MIDHLAVKIWHGGKLRLKPKIRFQFGETKVFPVDVDRMSFFELADYVMDTGSYTSKNFKMFYVVPGKRLHNGLVELKNDADVSEMINVLGDDFNQLLHLYVQSLDDILADEEAQSSLNLAHESVQEKAQLSPVRNPNPSTPTVLSGTDSTPQKKLTKLAARRLSTPESAIIVPQPVVESSEACEDSNESEYEASDELESEDEYVGDSLVDSEDDDERKLAVANLKQVSQQEEQAHRDLIKNILATSEANLVEATNDTTPASSYEDSDAAINSPGESEEDDIRGKKHKLVVPSVEENTDWTKWTWVVGTRFPTREAFKTAVRKYAVAKGRNLKISVSNKNRGGRVGASCVQGCPFRVYCSYHEGKGCFLIRSVAGKHNCQRSMSKNRQLTAEFVADEFLPVFKAKPHWSAKEINGAIQEKFKVFTTKWLAYNAKRVAHRKLHGSMKEHYCKLGAYIKALKDANPTSIFELMTVPSSYYQVDSDIEVFFRLFVCFDGVKKGFLAGCRRLLCLDGCFLKTFLGGMLLAAIGRDANDQMFPVAWAVVEGENNDSWSWFMYQLKKALNVTEDGKDWTLVSDQQKGLLNAVVEHWDKAEHRNCARHIYANWHKKFKGENLRDMFWKVVRAYCEADFKKAFEELKEENSDAADALLQQNPKCFCRAFLDTTNKADVVVNNMAETFNGYIIQSRSKHLINMLEDIRVAIMSRLVRLETQMAAKDVIVCPRIQQKLDKEKDRAYKCEIFPSSSTMFQVRAYDDVSVDMNKWSCTCRKWDLTGIPCYHACSVIGFLRKQAEDYVHNYYKKDMYMKTYQFTIPPLPSEKYWSDVHMPLDPPPIRAQPGRPKKNRKKDAHELPKKPGKLSKHGCTVTCGNCKEKGHNKRKCPVDPKTSEDVPKRPRGRPKKQHQAAETQDA